MVVFFCILSLYIFSVLYILIAQSFSFVCVSQYLIEFYLRDYEPLLFNNKSATWVLVLSSTRMLLLTLLLVVPAFAALYTHPSQLPTLTYDYIIVGGVYLPVRRFLFQTIS